MFGRARMSALVSDHDNQLRACRKPTKSAPLTDSSHKSIMNSSKAIDSLSTLMRR